MLLNSEENESFTLNFGWSSVKLFAVKVNSTLSPGLQARTDDVTFIETSCPVSAFTGREKILSPRPIKSENNSRLNIFNFFIMLILSFI